MAYMSATLPMREIWPDCRCRSGAYPPSDPFQRTWWFQITSDCPTHFVGLPTSVKVRILINEGVRL